MIKIGKGVDKFYIFPQWMLLFSGQYCFEQLQQKGRISSVYTWCMLKCLIKKKIVYIIIIFSQMLFRVLNLRLSILNMNILVSTESTYSEDTNEIWFLGMFYVCVLKYEWNYCTTSSVSEYREIFPTEPENKQSQSQKLPRSAFHTPPQSAW